jgi:hypothetical protein
MGRCLLAEVGQHCNHSFQGKALHGLLSFQHHKSCIPLAATTAAAAGSPVVGLLISKALQQQYSSSSSPARYLPTAVYPA